MCDHAFGITINGVDRCAFCGVAIPCVDVTPPYTLRDDPADDDRYVVTCTGHEDDGCAADLGTCDACGYVYHDLPQAADNAHDDLCCGTPSCTMPHGRICVTHMPASPDPDEPCCLGIGPDDTCDVASTDPAGPRCVVRGCRCRALVGDVLCERCWLDTK
jgi:hypothetical protein